MLYQLNYKEEKNRKKAMIISGIIHALILLLAILPLMKYPVPPPGQAGVLVSFGEPDRGSGADTPDTQQEEIEEETREEVEEVVEEKVEEVTEPTEAVEEKQTEAPAESKEVVTAEDLEAARIKKEKEEAKKRKEEEDRKEKARIAKEKAKKEEEARRKAQKKKEYEEAKKQYGDLFGDGKGSTDEAGNQGDPNGDPNSDILEGVSTGTGTVGGGLGNRGVNSRPSIKDNSQDRGVVVVKVCVNSNGDVISAEYTQKGSYSISDNLRRKSVDAAKKFKFTSSSISKQCGTITFDYKLQ